MRKLISFFMMVFVLVSFSHADVCDELIQKAQQQLYTLQQVKTVFVEAQSFPANSRRKNTFVQAEEMITRLTSCETLLRNSGIDRRDQFRLNRAIKDNIYSVAEYIVVGTWESSQVQMYLSELNNARSQNGHGSISNFSYTAKNIINTAKFSIDQASASLRTQTDNYIRTGALTGHYDTVDAAKYLMQRLGTIVTTERRQNRSLCRRMLLVLEKCRSMSSYTLTFQEQSTYSNMLQAFPDFGHGHGHRGNNREVLRYTRSQVKDFCLSVIGNMSSLGSSFDSFKLEAAEFCQRDRIGRKFFWKAKNLTQHGSEIAKQASNAYNKQACLTMMIDIAEYCAKKSDLYRTNAFVKGQLSRLRGQVSYTHPDSMKIFCDGIIEQAQNHYGNNRDGHRNNWKNGERQDRENRRRHDK